MTTLRFNYFAITISGHARYFNNKPKLENVVLLLQGCFYPRDFLEWAAWEDESPYIRGRIFIVKNEPMETRVHWFNPKWGWERAENIRAVPSGHAYAITPPYIPGWAIDYLPQHVAR